MQHLSNWKPDSYYQNHQICTPLGLKESRYSNLNNDFPLILRAYKSGGCNNIYKNVCCDNLDSKWVCCDFARQKSLRDSGRLKNILQFCATYVANLRDQSDLHDLSLKIRSKLVVCFDRIDQKWYTSTISMFWPPRLKLSMFRLCLTEEKSFGWVPPRIFSIFWEAFWSEKNLRAISLLKLCATPVTTLCDPCCNFARPNLAMLRLCAAHISYVATLCDSTILRVMRFHLV